MASQTIESRLYALEEASGDGGGGCGRCRGLLVTVRSAPSGTFKWARWNGEEISEDEVIERSQEARCPRCGRDIDQDEETHIKIGGKNDGNDREAS
jgi:adenine-specific DNA methylase